MKYCRKCLMPDTKPHLSLGPDGVCGACLAHRQKNQRLAGIDWRTREQEFIRLIAAAKSRQARFYDVLVPVSGGKDSMTQVARLLPFEVRILAVNVDYGIKTEIGEYNLSLIADMGANLAIYRPEQKLHKQLIRMGLEDFGDPDLLSHTLLHAYPLHLALQFQVPLVVLGENSAFEYGGDDDLASRNYITRAWFDKYAANSGRDARYVSQAYGIPFEKLVVYDYPDELNASGTQAVFMSHFFHWDSEEHLKIAQTHGFKALESPREGTYRNYVGIDEKINRIHQYLKVLKFGYGRATDHACEDIRNGRLTREQAKQLVRAHDLEDLSDYYVDDFVAYLGYSKEEFYLLLEKFRNRAIWQKDEKNRWYIPNHLEDGG